MQELKSGFVLDGVPISPGMEIGATTSSGAADGTTIVDANLDEAADYWIGATLLILNGDSVRQSRTVVAYDGTDTLTVEPGFDNQIASGEKYLLLTGTAAAYAKLVLGADNADNAFSSANVTPDRDGSVFERLEEIADDTDAIQADEQDQVFTEQSPTPPVDEDGGHMYAQVGIVDRDDGEIASADIDISSATTTLEKSTGGGSFSTTGITQPTLQKKDGAVFLDFDIDESEWSIGDTAKLEASGVTAADDEGDTHHLGPFVWFFTILEDVDLEATVEDIDTDLGEPGDAAVEPDGGSGTAHAKLAGIGVDVDTIRDSATTASPTADSIEDELDRLLGQAEAQTGSVNDGGATATQFDTDLGEADGFWEDHVIVFTEGSLQGQSRVVDEYTSASGTITVKPGFTSAPTDGDSFSLIPRPVASILTSVDPTSINLVDGSALDRLAENLKNDPNQALADILSDADIDSLTTQGDSLADRVSNIPETGTVSTQEDVDVDETTGTHSHSDNTNEQTAVDRTGDNGDVQVYLDLSNFTNDVIVREKRPIDGANYRSIVEVTEAPGDVDGYVTDTYKTNSEVRVTLESVTGEGASRDVPFEVMIQ